MAKLSVRSEPAAPVPATFAAKAPPRPSTAFNSGAAPAKKKRRQFGNVTNAKGVAVFTRQLATLVKAGMPILRSLEVLARQEKRPAFKDVLETIADTIRSGGNFSDGLAANGKVFDRLYINMVKAGEAGGVLDTVLERLSVFMEKAQKIQGKVKSAMIYPAVLLVTGIVSVLLLLVFVVPQFATMFEDAGTQIPPAAQFLLNLSGWLQRFGFLIPASVVAAYIGWRQLDTAPSTRLRRDRFLLSLPLFGKLILTRESAVFARTLGSLLGAGIPLIRALRVSREVVANTQLSAQLVQVEEDVRGGTGLGSALEKTQQFPTLLHQLVAVGEESGRTATILVKSAATFDTLVRNQMASLVAALQPALILVLALAVGGITITMLSAVFSMNAVEF